MESLLLVQVTRTTKKEVDLIYLDHEHEQKKQEEMKRWEGQTHSVFNMKKENSADKAFKG